MSKLNQSATRRAHRTRRIGAAIAAVVLVGAAQPAHASASNCEPVRVLSWNIYHGGKNTELGGEKNFKLLLDQLTAIAPDVFFSIETYGSAEEIRSALSARGGKGDYRAVRITSSNNDNLWIFTRYKVVETFPAPTGSIVSNFHIGGARVEMPNGRRINLFDTWVSYTDPWIGDMIDTNANDVQAGRQPTYNATKVAQAEEGAQIPQLQDIVHKQLPRMLGDNRDPILLAGDLNTLPADDWSAKWAHCPNHYGLTYKLKATKLLTDAGFRDTYREAHPDACTHPGRTWSPHPDYASMITPDRIDFIFARGASLRVNGAFTVDRRLPHHDPGPFYSDHAAVVTDLTVD